ncbi:hypothetical protein GRI44_07010 [Altererythrobacter confluentis]|uniref:Uncharacterized protein n=1 Tax=Allopontixanthobacter confluentis TaxID=1849021 RepID=A0A6L7GHV0_9SPHN|nr:hypothetical protein [Allopontixanthobacter confluentis]MXP14498.1 hypothetical protein [Allopontixanthobacter confluentis]
MAHKASEQEQAQAQVQEPVQELVPELVQVQVQVLVLAQEPEQVLVPELELGAELELGLGSVQEWVSVWGQEMALKQVEQAWMRPNRLHHNLLMRLMRPQQAM